MTPALAVMEMRSLFGAIGPRHGVRAALFTLGEVAAEWRELGCHGYRHQLRFRHSVGLSGEARKLDALLSRVRFGTAAVVLGLRAA